MLSATEILKIPINMPGKIFSKNKVKDQYRAFALTWHPDKSDDPKATDVFHHINQLHAEALKQIKLGTWVTPNEYMFIDKSSAKEYVIRYKSKVPFELGEMLISDTVLAYIVDEEHKDLYENGVRHIKSLKYKNPKMEKEFSKLLPQIKADQVTRDGKRVLIVSKTKDQLLARDVLNHFDGKVDPKHVAWMLSRLHNLLCYLQVSGLTHNNISLDTYFISPDFHSGAILGGWWYARSFGSKLLGVPKSSYKLMTTRRKDAKLAYYELDSELLRLMGRSLLGDSAGTKLLADKNIPKQFADWVRLPGSGNAIKDYDAWMKEVLIKSFGKRRFVKLELSSSDLY